MTPRSGILLVDKPAGVSSFSVVDHVRRALLRADPDLQAKRPRGRRGAPRPPRFRCGHAGTLDPMATGLLVILVGKGSRLSPFLMGMDKSYAATVRFGAATDTLDREGRVTATAEPPAAVSDVVDRLADFTGPIDQVPPLISALKRDGKPLYKRVRDGEDVPEPEARRIEIHRLELCGVHWGLPLDADLVREEPGILGHDGSVHQIDLLVECSSGTYVRSLARDLAAAAGTVGHLHALRRLSVGPFPADDALAGVMDLDGAELAAAMRPLGSALAHLPQIVLDSDEIGPIRNGAQPQREWLERMESGTAGAVAVTVFRLSDRQGELVAVGEVDPGTGDPRLAAVIPQE